MHRVALSTIDNPFNPLTEFDEWYAYDETVGHHTSSYLGRIVHTSNDLSDADQVMAIESAIDEIIEYNVTGMYIKVVA